MCTRAIEIQPGTTRLYTMYPVFSVLPTNQALDFNFGLVVRYQLSVTC